MTRLLLVGHTGELGGAEFIMLDVARHYGPRCHAVLFADGPVRGRLQEAGVGVTLLTPGRAMLGVRREAGRLRTLLSAPSVARTAWRLARLARGFDVIYPNSQKAAVVAMLAGPLAGRPVVWHLHDILSPEHFAVLQRKLVARLANLWASRVIANSEASRRAFVASGGDPRRVTVVPNGVDAAPFDAIADPDAAALRRSLGLDGVKLVGLFGRLAPWKGQHVFVDALAALPGVHVLLVGDALFGETGYREELRARASRLGVADRVHWLGFRADVPRLMRAVDAVVHTSTSEEPFGRVIVEAMLAGRPVLAADHGAARELLGENAVGLVPPGDPARLAAAVSRVLMLPPKEARALVERNRDRAQRLFSLPGMLRGIEDAVERAA